MSTVPAAVSGKKTVVHNAARATGITIVLVLLSRVLGVVRDMVVTAQFGQNTETSIYAAAFRVPDLIALVIAGGALSSVFVPVFTGYLAEEREEEAWRVFGSVVTIASVVIAAIVIGMEIFTHELTRWLFPKFSEEAIIKTAALSRILLPAQWCLLIGGLMNGTLYARKRFLTPALSPLIYNGGAIVGGLLFAQTLGTASMAWGVLVGAVIGSILLPAGELIRSRAPFRPAFDTNHEGVRRVGALFLPAVLGLSLSQMVFWITGFFLPDDFRISALRNAYNITQAPIGVFAQAFGIVLLPTISALAAKSDWDAFRDTLQTGLRRVLFLTVPASILMCVLAEPIVRVLFRRFAFTEHDVPLAAAALVAYSTATFAWSAMTILARAFYAMQDSRTPVYITTPLVFVFAALCWISQKMDNTGYVGLAASASLVAVIAAALFVICLQSKLGGLDLRGLAVSTGKTFAAALFAGLSAYLLAGGMKQWAQASNIRSFVLLAAATALFVAVYALAARVLRMPELMGVLSMVRRRGNSVASADIGTE